MNRTHVTWSIEVGGKCPCGGEVALIVAKEWDADEASMDERFGKGYFEKNFSAGVRLAEEVTGHVCVKCGRLTSLSLNVGR